MWVLLMDLGEQAANEDDQKDWDWALYELGARVAAGEVFFPPVESFTKH